MINFEFGDVVLVPFPFPFTDQSAGKKRPAVVISSVAYNNERPDLIIMAVTSQINPCRSLAKWLFGNGKSERIGRNSGLLGCGLFKASTRIVDGSRGESMSARTQWA